MSVLALSGLTVRYGAALAVDGLDLSVAAGETLALVGQSGSGKSSVALAILGLLPPDATVGGEIRFGGAPVLDPREIRGGHVGMVFQEPLSAFNPVLTIGEQIGEVAETHLGLSRRRSRALAAELLDRVGIAEPSRRARQYPHELSGGMRQRAMIAMALAGEPELLIADEPTTALDPRIQLQILDLLRALQAESGLGILLVTHDFGVVAEVAQRVVVLHRGKMVEEGATEDLMARPRQAYTAALLDDALL